MDGLLRSESTLINTLFGKVEIHCHPFGRWDNYWLMTLKRSSKSWKRGQSPLEEKVAHPFLNGNWGQYPLLEDETHMGLDLWFSTLFSKTNQRQLTSIYIIDRTYFTTSKIATHSTILKRIRIPCCTITWNHLLQVSRTPSRGPHNDDQNCSKWISYPQLIY